MSKLLLTDLKKEHALDIISIRLCTFDIMIKLPALPIRDHPVGLDCVIFHCVKTKKKNLDE
jgi:hypothetical protein